MALAFHAASQKYIFFFNLVFLPNLAQFVWGEAVNSHFLFTFSVLLKIL